MKRLVGVIFVTSFFGFSAICRAQDCSNWSNEDLRGTYATSGDGWIDLSKLNPALPAGYTPKSFVGAIGIDGWGNGKGWLSLCAGGIQMTMEFVNMTYDVKSNCSVAMSYSLKVKELGITIGPMPQVAVIAGNGLGLELIGMEPGTGPGSQITLIHSRRISMQFK